MTKETKSFLKKLLIFDIVLVVVVLVISMAFIVPSCTYDCAARGELAGYATGQLLIATNILAGIWWWVRRRTRKTRSSVDKSSNIG